LSSNWFVLAFDSSAVKQNKAVSIQFGDAEKPEMGGQNAKKK